MVPEGHIQVQPTQAADVARPDEAWVGVLEVAELGSTAARVINPPVPGDWLLRDTAFTPDGSHMALLFSSNQIWVLDLRGREPLLASVLAIDEGNVIERGLRVTDSRLLLGRSDGRTELYDIRSLRKVWSRELDCGRLTAVEWDGTPERQTVLVGTEDFGVLLHDVSDKE